MIKKIAIFTSLVLIVLFACSFTFATSDNLGDTLHDSLNKTGESMSGVKDAAMNAGNDLGHTVQDIGDNVKNGANSLASSVTNNNGYTATRTAANGTTTFMGMSSTAWIWLVFGIVALAVILLSWYYMSDANKHDRVHND